MSAGTSTVESQVDAPTWAPGNGETDHGCSLHARTKHTRTAARSNRLATRADERACVNREDATRFSRADWRVVDRALRTIAARRAALDAEEARWLREAEALQIWRHLGMVNAIDYMERVLGYRPRSAEERLRVARALGSLPVLEQALATGELPFSAVRELTRVAMRQTEAAWLDQARGKNVHEIEQLVAGHRPGDTPDAPPDPTARMHVVRLELTAEAYALFRQASAVLRDEHCRHLDDSDLISAAFTRVLDAPASSELTGRAKHQIAITLCAGCRQGWQDGAGATLPIDEAAVARAECDAQYIGSLDADTPARAWQDVSRATARFVWRRDHGRCRVPGCRSSRSLEIHHIVHRCDGGGHDPSNLILLCGSCHRAHHEGRIAIAGTSDRLEVRRLADADRLALEIDDVLAESKRAATSAAAPSTAHDIDDDAAPSTAHDIDDDAAPSTPSDIHDHVAPSARDIEGAPSTVRDIDAAPSTASDIGDDAAPSIALDIGDDAAPSIALDIGDDAAPSTARDFDDHAVLPRTRNVDDDPLVSKTRDIDDDAAASSTCDVVDDARPSSTRDVDDYRAPSSRRRVFDGTAPLRRDFDDSPGSSDSPNILDGTARSRSQGDVDGRGAMRRAARQAPVEYPNNIRTAHVGAFEAATARAQAKDALTRMGYKPHIAREAIEAAIAALGQLPLEQLVFQALRRCPAPRR
jgi:HNH endonuclease